MHWLQILNSIFIETRDWPRFHTRHSVDESDFGPGHRRDRLVKNVLQPPVDVPGVEAFEAGVQRWVPFSVFLFVLVRVTSHGAITVQHLTDVWHEEQKLQEPIYNLTKILIRHES